MNARDERHSCLYDFRARRRTVNISTIISRTIYLSSSSNNTLRCVLGDDGSYVRLSAGENVMRIENVNILPIVKNTMPFSQRQNIPFILKWNSCNGIFVDHFIKLQVSY